MTPFVPATHLLAWGLLAATATGALWLIRYVKQLQNQLPSCNADMVLTEHPVWR